MSEKSTDAERRRLLALLGSGLATGLAGCSGGGGGGGGGGGETTDTPTATPTPTSMEGGGGSVPAAIDDFLTADPAAGNYDGSIVDATGQSEVVIDVGAEGNGGNFAFSPPAVRVSTGTTVVWEWTGQGGLHNVVSVEASELSFDSGDPAESGPFERTFDGTGIGLYQCIPHKSLGMKGGIEVVG